MKIVRDVVAKTAPDFSRPCPFKGIYAARNMTIERKYIQIFPEGKYRVVIDTESIEVNEYFQLSLIINIVKD